MKPEPLKDKGKCSVNSYKNINGTYDDVHLDKDIKSAVEWYLKELRKGFHPSWTKAYKAERRLINKAFEDVIKK